MSAAETPTPPPQQATAPPRKPWRLIMLIAVAAAAAAAGATWFLRTTPAPAPATEAEAAEAKAPAGKGGRGSAPAQYFALGAPLVVNLAGPGPARYLQVEVELVARDAESLALIEHNAPALRAELLLLFAQQEAEALATREGKQRLQREALEEVRRLLTAESGNPSADALLFTSFVMQ